MPFTISHAAAVLPLSRQLRRFKVLAAAVVGSMVPDFGYLLPWRSTRFETHSAVALATFCLPVGLASYWIFELSIKNAILEILPDKPYARSRPYAPPASFGSLRQWCIAIVGIEGGAVLHLIWDGFTHEGARGVRMIPALNDTVADIAGHHLLAYALLQQLSSVLGLAVVLWIAWRALHLPAPQPVGTRALGARERRLWFGAYAAAALLAGGAALFARQAGGFGMGAIADDVAVAALRGMAASLLAVSLCLDLRLRLRR